MGYSNEELRRGWVRAERMLRRVYRELGPKEVKDGKFRPYPSRLYAKLTAKRVDQMWNFDHRHLMHKVAKTIEAE